MSASFLHGVETVEVNAGSKPVSVVKSAVIGLVGTAPIGSKDVLTLVKSKKDAAQFGSQLPGFTIPQALDSIFAQGAGTVLVVNVFDVASDVTAVTDESHSVTDGKFSLTYAPVADLVITNSGGTTTYVKGTHYTVDDFGNVTIIPGSGIAEGASLLSDYKRLNTSSIADADVIGSVSGSTRTGMELFDTAMTLFGYKPRILIAPGYSTDNEIAAALIAKAVSLKGHALIDAPIGKTVSGAIAGRGVGGTFNFATSNKRAILCYPHVKAYDPATGTSINKPLSSFLAGVMAATDLEFGYWYSPSNKEILGITGIEIPLTAALNDPTCDVNTLNEVGICTVFAAYGTGFRTWGNRSAAYPSNTDPDNFINVRRTADVIQESLELAMLPYIDQPLNNAVLDAVTEEVNSFLRTLQGRGAVVDGSCWYDPEKNPAEELAAGHVLFEYDFMPPTPAERFTFESYINKNLLNSLGA